MEIGLKLKNARLNSGYTQEQAARELGVSRQSISSWENNRAYPEISYVIKMSKLYSLSLDELLRDKDSYVDFIQKSAEKYTNINSDNKRVRVTPTMILELVSLLIIWIGFSLHYYFAAFPQGITFNDNTLGYQIIVYIFCLPPIILILSGFIGADKGWKRDKWFLIPVIAFSGQLIMTLTFGERYSVLGHSFLEMFISLTLPESMISLGGMVAGVFIGKAIQKARRNKHGVEQEASDGKDAK